MVRKSSDMVMLLGSRGRTRSRSAFGKSGIVTTLRSAVDNLLGRARRRDERPRRAMVSAWACLFAVVVAFGGGYAAAGGFGAAPGSLQAKGPVAKTGQEPGFLDEAAIRPLANEAFIVAIYRNVADADALTRAKALSGYLHSHGITKARPFSYSGIWTVAVYYDGETEWEATRTLLAGLPVEVPDPFFAQLRSTEAKWPVHYKIDG